MIAERPDADRASGADTDTGSDETIDLTEGRGPGVDAPLVLIAHGDGATRATIETMLHGTGAQVRSVADAAAVRSVARSWAPDVIFLDVLLPGTDGVELCRRLRAATVTVATRILLVTALDDPALRLQALEAGADGLLVRPFRRAELLARIAGVARINRTRWLAGPHAAPRPGDTAAGRATTRPPGPTDAELAARLDGALARLTVALQPIVGVGAAATTGHGHEVLLRSDDPVLAGPAAVLAAATRLERMADVGRTVRTKAASLIDRGLVTGPLFVNVSGAELVEGVLEDPDEPLRAHASSVILEITEQEAVGRIPDIRGRLDGLRAIGFRFAVDDLGVGYSGLNNLAVLEPEYAKLDRVLVTGLAAAPVRRAIIRSVVELCEVLDIRLIGEGVETASDRDALAAVGCLLQQGWLHGPPEDQAPAAP